MALEINRRRDHREWIAINLNNLGNVARDQRRLEESARLQHDSLAMFEALDDAWGRAMALRDLACAEYDLGRLEEAAQRFETSRSICEQVGDRRGVSFALMGMAYIRMDQQRFRDAQQLLAESLEITTSLSDRWTTAKCIEGFGLLAAARGQLDRCERLIREAGALRRRIGAPRTPNEQYMILDRAAECFPNRAELVRDDNTHDEMDLRKLIAYARTDDEDESAKALAPSPVRGPAAVTRVLVVDDERSYRETLRVFLEPFHDQVDVVGETGTSEQAIVAASELRPDVVFLDLKIPVRPGMHAPSVKNGIAAIRAIRRESRDTAILIVSTSDQEPMDLFEAIRAGAVGYLAKTDVVDGRDLIKSINAVTRGQAFLGPAIEKLVRRYFALETGTEPTHEELDALDDVVRGGPAATVPTIVRKIQSSDLDSSALSSPAAVARPIKIFISYSHVDEQLKNELLKHLSVLSRIGVVDAWHDRMIDAGTDWREAIDDRLDTADVALLLISADFISSQYCWGAEMKSALARRARGEIHVIPVIMRACDWENAQFASLQVLPRDAVAIASHPDRDAAFAEVAREMRKLVDKLRAPQPLQVSSPLAPQPPAASRPRTVDAGGGAEHRTIGEAIEAAAPGECIHVKPGRYRECLTISKRLEIVGDGETADVVIEAENAPVVTFEADEGTLRRLSLRMIGGDASCVEIHGDLELHECDISSSGSFGVAIRGPGHPTLRRNRIHDCRGVGVLIIQPSQAILEGNEVVNNQALGILITGADPTLRSNDVKWNNRGGILIEQYSAGTLEDNEISKNQSFGVVVSSGANPRLTGNRIRGNADAGVGVSDATGSLEDNDVSDNDQGGVTIMVGAAPHLAGNDIHDNRGFGVSISQASMGELENNTIRGNSAVGVEIGAECKPIVSANQIHRNGGVGISIDEGAGGVLTNNDLTDNVAGAWLLPPGGAPLVERQHNAE